ncbi:MAG: Ig-like domain-containing protein, partial [Holophagales bacterium]|nr:Ig-like domain-containing protein [Holophagales bacterium]
RFDPSQPYAPSTYGGYTIELLAGSTVIASDSDTQDPPALSFVDAVAVASAGSIPPSLLGQPLSIRLGISATEAQRSTHFDDVRLDWTPGDSGNAPPSVSLTSPTAGATFTAPATVSLEASASDADGSVAEVRFYEGAQLLSSDSSPPYAFTWTSVAAGTYTLTAVVEDNEGATTTSSPVSITVQAPGAGNPITVANASFELPALADSVVQSSGIPDWTFDGTSQTYRGVFNPPAGSYPTAAGQGTPPGADGAQVAFLFNNGGPTQSVSAVQVLGETVAADRDYTLTVAIGRFDPSQPYAPSTYGGYTIELLAGSTVIASDSDTQDPPALSFVDAVAVASASSIPPSLLGQPLSIRLGISATEAQRSTHFDDVRLDWSATGGSP